METVNSQVSDMLREGGVSSTALTVYHSELSPHTDNLETLGCYWAQKIAQLNINIRPHADVCIFLRDTSSEILWLNFFKQRVVPIVVNYRIFE